MTVSALIELALLDFFVSLFRDGVSVTMDIAFGEFMQCHALSSGVLLFCLMM